MTKIDRIAQLLVGGMNPALVASVVGVSKSYISQLLQDQDFKAALKELAEQQATEAPQSADEVAKDKMIGIEHAAMDQLQTQIESGMLAGRELILALATLNTIKNDTFRREAASKAIQNPLVSGQGQMTMKVVEITMPAICAPELTIGPNSEIIAIGSRSTTPMPASSLQKMLEAEAMPPIEGESHHETALQY